MKEINKNKIMKFFKDRKNYFTVCEITKNILDKNDPTSDEMNFTGDLLHKLKSKKYLMVENEGADVYVERFSSTSEKIAFYFNRGLRIKKWIDENWLNLLILLATILGCLLTIFKK